MNYTLLITICVLSFLICLILINFEKLRAFFSSLKSKRKSMKDLKPSKNKNVKLKLNPAQTRPILRPPQEKMLEAPKETDSSYKAELKNEYNPSNSTFNEKDVKLNKEGVLDFSSNYTPNKTNKFKTKEELDREFDEIRNFLSLPNLNSSNPRRPIPLNNKIKPIGSVPINNDGIKREKLEVFNNNRIDEEDIGYNFSNNEHKFLKNENKIFNNNQDGENDFYNKKTKNVVTIDGDEIDLNKLPVKIRKLLISNILARKNFD